MVRHQDPRIKIPLALLATLPEHPQKHLLLLVILENSLFSIPAAYNVIKCSSKPNERLASHEPRLSGARMSTHRNLTSAGGRFLFVQQGCEVPLPRKLFPTLEKHFSKRGVVGAQQSSHSNLLSAPWRKELRKEINSRCLAKGNGRLARFRTFT